MLTADTSGISDADGLGAFSYQWLRNGGVIAGATAGTYTLGDADVGTLISVQVAYTDAQGTGEGPLTSAQTAAVASVNDAPVISSLPPAQTVFQDTELVFSTANGNAIAISDVDAGAATVQLSLTATEGTLTLATIGGLGFTIGDGTGDSTMTFTGSQADINAALNGLRFTSTTGFVGSAALSVMISDQGNTGAGGPLVSAGAVSIGVITPLILIDPGTSKPSEPPIVAEPTEPEPTIVDSGASNEEQGDAPETVESALIASGGNTTPLNTVLADTQSKNTTPPAIQDDADSQSNRSTRIAAAGSGFDIRYFALSGADLTSGEFAFAVTPPTALPAFDAGVRALQAPEFVDELDRLHDSLEEQSRVAGTLVTASSVATMGLSVGYLFWLLRAEVLLGSLLSSLPAWRLVDPLPVLGRLTEEEDEDDDSLESLVERNNRLAQAASVQDIEAI